MDQHAHQVAQSQIADFLDKFFQKMSFWDIAFRSDERRKNTQGLLDLEMTTRQRREVIESLTVEDFCGGPLPDSEFNEGDMMVFGKMFKKREIYIKISLGKFNSPVVVISFHPPEFPLKYPLKSNIS